MVVAIVVTLLVVWIAVGVAVALLIGRAARMGEIAHRDEVFLASIGAERRTPARV